MDGNILDETFSKPTDESLTGGRSRELGFGEEVGVESRCMFRFDSNKGGQLPSVSYKAQQSNGRRVDILRQGTMSLRRVSCVGISAQWTRRGQLLALRLGFDLEMPLCLVLGNN